MSKINHEEINSGDKLIADFLGWTFKRGKFTTQLSNSSGEYYDHEVEEEIWWDETDYPQENGLQFYRSWDALMPVLAKIGKINFDNAKGMREYMKENWDESKINIYSPRKVIWEKVVEFIKWYNQNKTK